MTLEGKNKITQPEEPKDHTEDMGLVAEGGSLAVQGDGSLDVTARTIGMHGSAGVTIDSARWDAWDDKSFAAVASPAIEGYTASIESVPEERVDGGTEDIVYEVVYVKDAEPEPEPEPEPTPEPKPQPEPTSEPEPKPQPKPAPAPAPASVPAKRAAVPATGDPASAAPGIAAALGSAIAALGAVIRRRR